jgi:serine/threonine protein kinase/Tol biopolymer transport system component
VIIGSTISHYKIIAKLGEGGMGVVYKAEDTKLERTVALKFLAQHLLDDDEAKERFLREAKAAAALHHSNVCPVYEIDEADGKTFLAMAFLQGETLEDRIAEGPFAIKDALDIARQVADGLEAAHEAGIVHRDIKPANVLIDPKGHATIMDFGLARLTEASRLTKVDTAMGTVAYMSPEQAQGMEVDHRSDVWALGCVLYEMVSGQRPFQGQYDQALLYEIVHEEVAPLTSIRAGVPMELEFIVGKCLAKDRDDRTESSREVARELRTLSDKVKSVHSTILRTSSMTGAVPAAMTGAHTLSPAATLPPDAVVIKRSSQRLLQVLAAVFAIAFLGLLAFHLTEAPTPSPPTVEFSVAAPEGLVPDAISLSPDGRHLVMSVLPPASLHVRALDSEGWRELVGTVGARYPFWSPDSDEIGFFADGRLKKVALAGGPSQAIAEAAAGRGGSWGADGTILFAPIPDGGQILSVPDSGGEPIAVTKPAEDDTTSRRFPHLLPDGRHFLYSDRSATTELAGVYLGSLDGAPAQRLLPDFSNAVYVPRGLQAEDGFILFVREGALMAQPFDPARLELSGGPIALPATPSQGGNTDFFRFSASPSGVLANSISASTAAGAGQTVVMDRSGNVVQDVGPPVLDAIDPAVSPNGLFVAASVEGDIWVYDLERNIGTRLTSSEIFERAPAWLSSSREVTYNSIGGLARHLASRVIDGSVDPKTLLDSKARPLGPMDWSPDNHYLVYNSNPGPEDKEGGIWYHERGADGALSEAMPYLLTPDAERGPQFSPDGRYLAYHSSESGRFEVYVRPFPLAPGKWQISTGGGLYPRWSADGTELFYVEGSTLTAVPVTTSPNFAPGQPQGLFASSSLSPVTTRRNWAPYDVFPDSQRFVAVAPVDDGDQQEPTVAPKIRIVLNWAEEFRDREQ